MFAGTSGPDEVRLHGDAGRADENMVTPQSIDPDTPDHERGRSGRLTSSRTRSRSSAATPIATSCWHPSRYRESMPSIVRKMAGYELRDMGSTRGTYLDGAEARAAGFLKDGNTMQIGELTLSFSGRLVQISEDDEEQSTVFAAIDVVNQSARSTAGRSGRR